MQAFSVDLPLVLRVGVVVALVSSLLVLWRIERPGARWGGRLRSRLLLGVPWGTLVCAAGVLAVYLFLQDGLAHYYRPVSVPFSSWSYLYPLGWLTAPFAHAGPGHLVGNLVGTLAFAPIAEYVWSHFPTDRGSSSFDSWRTNPYVRAFVLFPAGVFLVGVATSVFAWGPVIGFSGVVFAFAGFALVRYPLAVVVAVVLRDAVDLLYRALQSPVSEVTASPSFSTPWWSQIAVQGHALGLLLGVTLGVALLYRRDERPAAGRLWLGTLLFATSLSLWAVYWFRGNDTYVLYRGAGAVLVLVIATGVVAAARASDSALWSHPTGGRVTGRQLAVIALLCPLVFMGGVAAFANLTTVDDASAPGDGTAVTVGDYTVAYAENVPNQMISVVDVSAFGESTTVNASGVIVVSDEREIWVREVSKGRLAFAGRAAVRVGGVGWRDTVFARRQGWTMTGGPTAYNVWLRPTDGTWRHAYASEPATADLALAGKNVSVVPREGGFFLRLSEGNRTLDTVPVPGPAGNVTAANITFVRDDGRLLATFDGTRVQVAAKESYN